MPRSEQAQFLENATPDELLLLFETSYASELVNVLLDLKKATVKHIFEKVGSLKKRVLAETATLYYYKEYLTNPLPLLVETDSGRSIANFYAILGVPRDASEDDLHAAYRLLKKAHCPEVFSPAMRKMGDERLQEIQEAYNQLKSPPRRARTDTLLPNINYLYPRRDQSWFEAVSRLLE